jgi:hypothetical protein
VLNVEVSVDELVLGMVSEGLRPPAPSSVEPIGIPIRPTVDAEPIPVGDEADAAGPPKELPPITIQVPDAVPAMPPPSNTVVDVEGPAVEMPVPTDVPAVALPMPDDKLPAPDDIPVAALPRPNEDSAIAPPMPLHAEALPVVGDAPGVIGLTPGDASSVAPRGIRTGGTGAAGPTPSGDVMPSGEGPGEICANTGPQPRSTTAVAAITKRVIRFTLSLHWNSSCAVGTPPPSGNRLPAAAWHAPAGPREQRIVATRRIRRLRRP